ncbi:unnamed protein product [Clavelina lepadiformis]|uniref:Uncharacterized protein n=1 Tax=Clavelina lepadiformis TaxID=159417 RepID=A0ABP0GSZ9_CLALP
MNQHLRSRMRNLFTFPDIYTKWDKRKTNVRRLYENRSHCKDADQASPMLSHISKELTAISYTTTFRKEVVAWLRQIIVTNRFRDAM